MTEDYSRKYFESHPLEEFSTARFAYSLYNMDGIEEL